MFASAKPGGLARVMPVAEMVGTIERRIRRLPVMLACRPVARSTAAMISGL
jgi:hypothetical protein